MADTASGTEMFRDVLLWPVSEFYIKLSSLAGMAFEKSLFSMIPTQRMGEKLEMCLESHRQIFEETRRIQDPVQFTSRKQNKT